MLDKPSLISKDEILFDCGHKGYISKYIIDGENLYSTHSYNKGRSRGIECGHKPKTYKCPDCVWDKV